MNYFIFIIMWTEGAPSLNSNYHGVDLLLFKEMCCSALQSSSTETKKKKSMCYVLNISLFDVMAAQCLFCKWIESFTCCKALTGWIIFITELSIHRSMVLLTFGEQIISVKKTIQLVYVVTFLYLILKKHEIKTSFTCSFFLTMNLLSYIIAYTIV